MFMCVQSCCMCQHYAKEICRVKLCMTKNFVRGESVKETLGERLREERDRLGINQNDLADIGGITRNSQGNYERGRQNPDTAYLLAISGIGVDVMYVLFGRRDTAAGTQTTVENEVLNCFRSLGPGDQIVVHRVATGLAEAAAKQSQGNLPLE